MFSTCTSAAESTLGISSCHSACTAAGERLAPELESCKLGSAQLSLLAEGKIRELDRWLWNECDVTPKREHVLSFDSLEAARNERSRDSPLFLGGAPPSALAWRGARPFERPEMIQKIDTVETKDLKNGATNFDRTGAAIAAMHAKRFLGGMPQPEDELESEMSSRARQENLAKVEAFLSAHKFTRGVNMRRRSWTSYTYPLHEAAIEGDVEMVTLLLQNGADKEQKDSKRRTALQVATVCDKQGSHRGVIAILNSKH